MKKTIKMCLSLLIIVTFLTTSNLTFAQVWDGWQGTVDTVQTIVDMNSLNTIVATSGVPSTKVTRSAVYTTKWENHTKTTSIRFNTVPGDWSDYGTVLLPIYSAVATNQTVVMAVYSEPQQSTGTSYFRYPITIDWTGWRVFEIEKSSFGIINSADWSKITYLQFTASSPNAQTEIYFDSITAVLAPDESTQDATSSISYTALDIAQFQSAISGGVGIYNFTGNVFADGQVKKIGENLLNTTVKNECVMTPVQMWSTAFGAKISGEGSEWSVSLNGKTIELKAEQVNDEFKIAPYMEEDTFYTPVIPMAEAFGMKAQTFGMMTVIGEQKHIDVFSENEGLEKVGGYVLSTSNLDASNVTEHDFVNLRKNWRYFLVGDETNNLEDENIKSLIDSIDKAGKSAWNSMNTNDDAPVLFGNTVVETTLQMETQYDMMWNMAKAYGTYGTSLYKNPQLKAAIFYAIERLYDLYYGEDEIGNNGWRDVFQYNWWSWYIGVPRPLLETLMVMEEEMLQSDINKYIAPFDYIRSVMRYDKNAVAAQTRCYVVTLSAALRDNVDLMVECLVDFDRLLTLENVEGPQKDFTYICHECYPLDGMYGTGILSDRFVEVATILAGTKFEITSAQKYNQALWVYNTFMPIVHNGVMFFRNCGRSPGFGVNYGRGAIKAAIGSIGCFSEDDDMAFKMFIKRSVTEESLSAVCKYLGTVYFANRLVEIMNDETLPEPEEYQRAHMRYKGDIAAWQRNGTSAFVSMSSERIGAYESINHVNMSGWYQGDGGLYVYTDKTDGIRDEFGTGFWNNANMHRLPGTTEDVREREPASISVDYLTPRDFVGGAELDGEYIAAAMDFEAYHFEEIDDKVDAGYGGGLPQIFSDLTAKKSYFMFDDEVVAVGSDIDSTNEYEVNTYIDNRTLSEKLIVTDDENSETKRYTVIKATAAGDDGNIPENVIDGSYDTRWSYEATSDGWLMLELEQALPVGYVGIANYGGTGGKQAIFDLQLSVDGQNWETVFSGKASGTTDLLEAYDCGGKTAKYVKFVGAGRTNSSWNSITEVEVYAPRADGKMVLLGATQEGIIYGTEDIIVDGVMLEKEAEINKKIQNPSWIHLECFGGYYLPKGGNAVINKENKASTFFELWLEHGLKPENETYSYVMLPQKTAEETAQYSKNPDIEILECTEKLHVVKEKTLGITAIVFWEAGSYGDISVSEPMVVIVKETENEYKIAASDPTQKSKIATIIIERDLTLTDCDAEVTEGIGTNAQQIKNNPNNSYITVSEGNNKATLTLDFTRTEGETLTATFRK